MAELPTPTPPSPHHPGWGVHTVYVDFLINAFMGFKLFAHKYKLIQIKTENFGEHFYQTANE